MNLSDAWSERGWDVHVVSLDAVDSDFYQLHPGVKRHALDLSGPSTNPLAAVLANGRRAWTLRRQLRSIGPDVVIGMMTSAAVLSILATRGTDCRVVAVEHNYPPRLPLSSMWERLRRSTYPHADRVVMLTSEGLDWLKAVIPSADGAVIPNAVGLPLPVTEPRVSPAKIVGDDERLLLSVGRLTVQKGFDRLLDAFTIVSPHQPRWRLVILGDGEDRAALSEQVMRSGLSQRVSLPGSVGNVGDWYGRADLFAMSSRFEGFPMTLAEALAHGCPAVSFDCDTGPRDLIDHDVNGLLIRPEGDVVALAAALDELMSDHHRRAAMAEQAVAVRDRYGMERILAMWDRVIAD